MRAILSAVAMAILAAAGASAEETSGMILHEEPQPVPEFVFTNESGQPRTLDDWSGKVVLLNVWATWCAPCRAEMPTLDRLQERLGGEEFEVVALSVDRAGAGVVRRFFDEIGIGLPVYVDKDGAALRSLALFGLPGTLLLGPDGNELGRLAGPADWDTPEKVTFFEGIIERHQERKKEP